MRLLAGCCVCAVLGAEALAHAPKTAAPAAAAAAAPPTPAPVRNPTPAPKVQSGRIRHVLNPTQGCPAHRVDGDLNCHPEDGASQKMCESRGCCWDADFKASNGNVGFCYPKDHGHGTCPYHKNAAINCHPEVGATEASCRARGCCWDKTTTGKNAIWCYPRGPAGKTAGAAIKLKAGATTAAPAKEKSWGSGKGPTDAMPTLPPGAEKALGDTFNHACSLVQVSAPTKTMATTPDLWGIYTLQYETMDSMPVYRQHTYVCDAAALAAAAPSSDARRLAAAAGAADVDMSCTAEHFTGAAAKKPRFLFYDGQAHRWSVAASLMAYSKDAFSGYTEDEDPTKVEAGGWGLADLETKVFAKNNDGIAVTCMDKKAKGDDAAHGRSTEIVTHKISKAGDSGCIKWRKTAGCDPTGPREHEQDQACDTEIAAKLSGYCECASGVHHKVACGHAPFTCKEKCVVSFPMVLAQSGERVWTNQVARNLLVPGSGDWFTSQTVHQWVVFDLGKKVSVKSVHFDLWGSAANPKKTMLQTAPSSKGPWAAVKRFVMGQRLHEYTTTLDSDGISSRYWRLYIQDNWGAKWGLGFNTLRFDDGSAKPSAPDPCHTFHSKETCIYLSATSSNIKMLEGPDHACGWCEETMTCDGGNPQKPSAIACDGVWLFNSLKTATTDPCEEHDDCDKCTDDLKCGWCISSNSCKSNYCKHWSDRQCGNTKSLLHQRNVESSLLQKTKMAAVGLVSAAALLALPTMVIFKRRRAYWHTRANMKDAGPLPPLARLLAQPPPLPPD